MTRSSRCDVGASLFCGLAVTVALAVLTPIAANFETALSLDGSGTSRHCVPLPSVGPRDYYRSWTMTSWLVQRVAVQTCRSSNDEFPAEIEFDPPETLPRWCTLDDLLNDSTQFAGPDSAFSEKIFVEQAAGWPLATTRCFWKLSRRLASPLATRHAWELPDRNSPWTTPGHFTRVRAIPTELLPIGAAANTAFWALVAGLFFRGLRLVVASFRSARGRCAQCGYVLVAGVSGQCPECGFPIRGRAA